MAKAKTTTGKTVTVEVIKSTPPQSANKVKYVTTDGNGRRTVLTGEAAMSIHRKTF